MTNAQKFQETFGIYATEMWTMSEHDFLKWLNADTPQTDCVVITDTSYQVLDGWQTREKPKTTDCPWK